MFLKNITSFYSARVLSEYVNIQMKQFFVLSILVLDFTDFSMVEETKKNTSTYAECLE